MGGHRWQELLLLVGQGRSLAKQCWRWGLDSAVGVDGALETVEGQHWSVNVGSWHSLKHGSDILDAMEHLIFCCNRRLGEVLMPELGCV